MKKMTTLLLVLLMLLSMAACAGNQDPTDPAPTDPWDQYKTISVLDALQVTIPEGQVTTERYYIRAKIVKIDNANYGAVTVSDGTGSIYVFRMDNADNSVNYSQMEDKPFAGDEVLMYCTLKNFNGTNEINNAQLIDFRKVKVEINEGEYKEMSILEARNAAKDTKVKVDGVVAKITYANGMIPSGVILVDETNSIYVYDGNLAAQVSIGNKITICASKTYWILDKEVESAAKFGYIGCNQLENTILVENDKKTDHVFDKSWITESTVKEIMDTPVSTDISTTIFKVTAQIKEVPGNGFTNFYINDLDGETGSYSYSQCNGSDFAWLREFDGKICTVYLMALNAKSTSADCFWRFLPIAVIDEGFDPSTVNGAEYAVKYNGLGQFDKSYQGNPKLELNTSVNNSLLGITGASLSYSSSDESVVKFETVDGKVIMNCLNPGKATVTVTGSYGDKTYTGTIEITVKEAPKVESITVGAAIKTPVGEKVIVKGIVGPSLVNRSGFYLIDETGVISIITDADTLASLKIGQEIVLEGKRDKFHNNEGDHSGQAALTDCKVVANYYGEHAYSTKAFAGDITVSDFYNLDIKTDYTTSVFTMKAYVVVVDGGFSSNIYLSNVDHYDKNNANNIYIRLYSSSAKQYNWLKAYAGKEVTVEINACNWNNKTYYTGCVLAVVHEDGTKTLNTLNFQN